MNINQILRKILNEATSDSTGSRGSYVGPLEPGVREFKKIDLQPFTIPVSKYNNAMLEYDSYDGSMSLPKKQINKLEKKSKKISDYIKNHPNSTFSDEDGNVINQTPGKNLSIVPINKQGKITESSTSVSAGEYSGPTEIGLKKWSKSELGPFYEFLDHDINNIAIKKSLKNNLKRIVGVWEKGKDGTHNIKTHDVHTMNEDLAVWFGKKKKPKGSKQPKGPWVNICRKVDGKHPPCGRPDTSKGSYPKCRAAGVAGKMSDSAKRAACTQKRNAEKKDTQTGKGQKPIMTSYKPKTNENMKRKIVTLNENDLMRIVKRVLTEQTVPKGKIINLFCQNDIRNDSFKENDLIFQSEQDMNGGIDGGGFKRLLLTPSPNSPIPRETYDPTTFRLDIVPAKKLNKDFLDQSNLDDPNATIYFMGYKYNSPYFCAVDYGTDPEWETYLNSF